MSAEGVITVKWVRFRPSGAGAGSLFFSLVLDIPGTLSTTEESCKVMRLYARARPPPQPPDPAAGPASTVPGPRSPATGGVPRPLAGLCRGAGALPRPACGGARARCDGQRTPRTQLVLAV